MKEILARHAEVLSAVERQAIWVTISSPRVEASRPGLRWSLSAAAAMVVALYAVLLWDPTGSPRFTAPERSPARIESPPGVVSVRPNVEAVPRSAVKPVPTVAPEAPSISKTDALPALPPAAPPGTAVITGRVTDSQNQPMPYANVTVTGTRRGAMTGEDGTYRIEGLPPATYSIRAQQVGYASEVKEARVGRGQTATVDIQFREDKVVKQIESIEVTARMQIDTKSSSTKQSVTGEKLRELPVDNIREAVGLKAGTVQSADGLHFRGGRPGEVKYQFSPPSPPVIPTTGGTQLPNDEPFDSMFFKNHGVNPFIATDEDALSTFAVDVDAASYTVARRYIELGHLPPPEAVRVEEFVNFFPQDYPRFGNEDFRILIDGAPSPFGSGYHLLRIGLKAREIEARNRKPAQLTFVIDVSGSMNREDRLELVKRALHLLVDQLRSGDRVGIVVYGSVGRILLEPVAMGGGTGRRQILAAIDQLGPEGSTNAEEGLRLGYEMAQRGYRAKATNRIILCSDGVANVGLTGPESILADVRTKAARGIHLTTIGFGMGNYNDVLMEQLADRGDGNYYYVDDIDEAHRVFVENLTGTLQTIAKDAKVQVEFDSTRVLRYRLLGFENRDVADRDFRNDKVDAGEIGAGHEVTALYEVKLAPGASQGTLATVRLRYASPEQDKAATPRVREIERHFDVAALSGRFEDAAPRFRLDAAVAEFAEILRGSYWAKESKLSDVLTVARSATRSLKGDATTGFIPVVEKAATLSARPKSGNDKEER
jgi:Ca-activated chloride channel family protein